MGWWNMRDGITLREYNRRFDMIMQAYQAGFLTPSEASDAMRELTTLTIYR
jgi:hypothetical protein